MESNDNLNNYTVAELKIFLHNLGKKTSGTKSELIQWLIFVNREAGREASYVSAMDHGSDEAQVIYEDEAVSEHPYELTETQNMPVNIQRGY